MKGPHALTVNFRSRGAAEPPSGKLNLIQV